MEAQEGEQGQAATKVEYIPPLVHINYLRWAAALLTTRTTVIHFNTKKQVVGTGTTGPAPRHFPLKDVPQLADYS
jgi:hypothetical protein